MKTFDDKTTRNLDGDAEVSVKGTQANGFLRYMGY